VVGGATTPTAPLLDNSPRWLIADQGIITAGWMLCVAPEREELLFILADSGSTALVVRPQDPEKLRDRSTPADSFGGLARMKSQRQGASDSDGSWFKPASTAGKSEPGYTDFDIHVWNLANPKACIACTTTGAVFGAVQPQPGDRFSSSPAGTTNAPVNLSSPLYANLPISATSGLAGIQTPDYGWPRLWESICEAKHHEQPTKQKLINFLPSSQRYIQARRIVQS